MSMNRRSNGAVPGWRFCGATLVVLLGGCRGELDSAGRSPRGGTEDVAEAAEALTSSQGCVQVWRQGTAGSVEDAQIVDKDPPKNYGTSSTMSAGWFGVPFVERQMLVRFDLGGIPSGPQINITAANVFLARGPLAPTGPGTIEVHRITAPWSETAVTWQSFGGAYDPTVHATFGNAGDYFGINLQPLVQSWIRGSLPNHGILLKETDTNGSNFYSSEALGVFSRPALEVCFTVTCAPSFADCNANAFDGCETDTKTTIAHCGGCAQACSLPHATPACVAGACQIGACNAGFADCDHNAANGCETPLDTITDCGACGVACAIPGGTGSCATGTCTLTACDAGYFDCDGDPSNGCEALPCADGQHCSIGIECAAGVCQSGLCAAPTCTDGVKNGNETGVDCGGGCSPCGPSCSDGVKNQDETGVDCGGKHCLPCADGQGCSANIDCQSQHCTGGTCGAACTFACGSYGFKPGGCSSGYQCDCNGACLEPSSCVISTTCPSTCDNGVRDGDETDVDCGGVGWNCAACAAGKRCRVNKDCQSKVCTGGTCEAPSCTDGVFNEDESDLDCGGTHCPRCVNGQSCNSAADCQSHYCVGGRCATPTCAISCPLAGYAPGECRAGGWQCDCGGWCVTHTGCTTDTVCSPAECFNSCAAYGYQPGECRSGWSCDCNGACIGYTGCNNDKNCTPPPPPTYPAQCSNGVKDSNESDVDCGGPCALCPDGKTCHDGHDCAHNNCLDGMCLDDSGCRAMGMALCGNRYQQYCTVLNTQSDCGSCGNLCGTNQFCGGSYCVTSISNVGSNTLCQTHADCPQHTCTYDCWIANGVNNCGYVCR